MKRAHELEESITKKARIESNICNIVPTELLMRIFKIIPQEHRRFSGVCKCWNNISNDKTMRHIKFGVVPITWLTRSEIIKWATRDEKIWSHISNFRLSLEFIHEHAAKLNWEVICRTYPLTQTMIEQYKVHITPYIYILCGYCKLNFDCEKIKDIINWDIISKIINDSNYEFIIMNYKYLHWKSICEHTQLSEKLMHDFANYLDWGMVSKYQNMSVSFLIAFKDKIIWKIYLSRAETETHIMELIENPELRVIIFQIYAKIARRCRNVFNLL